MLHKMLNLTRPLVSLDLETTGIKPREDRIVQIGICKLRPTGEYTEWKTYVNPGIPIPKEVIEAMAEAAITDDMVKDAPMFPEIAAVVHKGLEGCDLLGYNLKVFDIPLLIAEFDRCRMIFEEPYVVDGYKLVNKIVRRNLSWFVENYEPAVNPFPDMPNEPFAAHDALHDARAVMRAFVGFMNKHDNVPTTVKGCHDLCFLAPRDPSTLDPDGKFAWDNEGKCVINFGKKHSGRRLELVARIDPGYLEWMLGGEFNPVVKQICKEALGGKFPSKV